MAIAIFDYYSLLDWAGQWIMDIFLIQGILFTSLVKWFGKMEWILWPGWSLAAQAFSPSLLYPFLRLADKLNDLLKEEGCFSASVPTNLKL